MKKMTKRILTMLLLGLTLAASLPVSAATVTGNGYYNCESNGGEEGKAILTYYPQNESYNVSKNMQLKKNKYGIISMSLDGTVSAKSSNPSVVAVSVEHKDETYTVYATAKKAGSATITITSHEEATEDYEGGDETETLAVTVKKYVNPFKSLKIGGKNVSTKTLKKQSVCSLKYKSLKNKKAKVSFKLVSGWKLNKGWSSCFTAKGVYKGSLKNGSKIKVTGGKGFWYRFRLKNSKTGQFEEVEVVLK